LPGRLIAEVTFVCSATARSTDTVLLFDIPWATYDALVNAFGDHRFRHTYQEGTLEIFDNPLYDIPWSTYEKILKAFGDHRFPHTYQHGTLEIMMSPSEEHELIASFLGRLVEATAFECGIPIRSTGSATRRHPKLLQGLEPDASYYIENPSTGRGKPALGRKTLGPPNLVIEVDIRRPDLRRLQSYAELGVTEIWRYRKGTVEFLIRSKKSGYKRANQSCGLPLLTPTGVTRFVQRLSKTDENSVLSSFVDWLRKQRPKGKLSD
jgi:Uma2 family endonuclease